MSRVWHWARSRLPQSLPNLFPKLLSSPLQQTISRSPRANMYGLCLVMLLVSVPIALQLVHGTASLAAWSAASSVEDDSAVAHGKYIVHHVAQCVQCHTPRDAQGQLVEAELLGGAAIPVVGPAQLQPWASVSVSLAGLGNYDDSFVRHVLVHGRRPDGTRPRAPMPTFELNDHDADCVIAYLKSLL